MLKQMLKPVKELLALFRKQNIYVKIVIAAVLVCISHAIVNELVWKRFSNVYLEGFSGNGKKMVLCHMNKCGWCKKMMPEWDKFASSGVIETEKIEVNDSGAKDKMRRWHVNSFPTILILNEKEEKIDEYEGERDSKSFAEYAAKIQ